MTNEFIKVIGMNESRSGGQGRAPATRIIAFDLSATPSPAWEQYFVQAWRSHIYMTKCPLEMYGAILEIDCVPADVANDHLPELKKIVAETNAALAPLRAEEERRRAAQASQEEKDAADMKTLKSQLKFD